MPRYRRAEYHRIYGSRRPPRCSGETTSNRRESSSLVEGIAVVDRFLASSPPHREGMFVEKHSRWRVTSGKSESSRPHYIQSGSSSIVNREQPTKDARAVEDPIAAIFDLAESVDRQTPKIRKTLRYVRWFVSVWLLLDCLLISLSAAAFGGAPGLALLLFVPIIVLLLAMRSVFGSTGRLVLLIFVLIFGVLQVLTTGGLVFLGAVLVALFILGFSILELMRDLRSFFDYFALRHRVIQRVRQADPVVYVPDGKDSVQRILTHLGATSSDVRGMMATPGAVATPALLTGKSGLTYSFDAYVRREPSTLWRAGLPAGGRVAALLERARAAATPRAPPESTLFKVNSRGLGDVWRWSVAQPERRLSEPIVVPDLLLVDLTVKFVEATNVEHPLPGDANPVVALDHLNGRVALLLERLDHPIRHEVIRLDLAFDLFFRQAVLIR